MRLSSSAVRFSLGTIPVLGNTATGAIVGLTSEGAALCDTMLREDVVREDIPESCRQLIAYLANHAFLTDASVPERGIHSAYLHVNNACNLSCVGCYSLDEGRNREPPPSLADLTHAMSVLSELGVEQLIISGGEPFLRNDLSDIAQAAKGRGIEHITILTNGTLCTSETLKALSGLVDTISVSFDGPSAQSRAYVRGNQLFDHLVATVRAIQAAGIHAHILPTLHGKNVEDVLAYLDTAQELGATIGFSLLSGCSSVLSDLALDNTCLTHLADVLFSSGVTAHGAEFEGNADPTISLGTRVACGAGKTGVSISHDGGVYPCHMLQHKPFLLGNAFTDTADAIRSKLASFSLPPVDAIDDCSACSKHYLCGGGCRARAYLEFGRLDRRDPYCTYYNRALNHAIDAFTSRFN